VKHAYLNSPFYRERLKAAKVDLASIHSTTDLRKLTFTEKEDLRKCYPFGLSAKPLAEVSRIHTSSGTTGDPTVVLYTAKDLDNWVNSLARCLTMTGVERGDIFQVILGYGLFTGGLGFHYAAERVGATVIPASTGNTRRQVKLMKDFGVTAFTSIPSYTLYLAEVAEEQGINPAENLKVKTISCGAEVWSESIRRRIEKVFGCSVFNSYGLSEVGGPGVAFECMMQNGLHVWSDQFMAEVVDPETGEPVEAEEKGELVLTTLTREAMPLLRYRTRDIASIMDVKTCACGRSHTLISWITGRADNMVKVRGVSIFPSQVEHVLMGKRHIGNNYQLVVRRQRYLDTLEVKVEVDESLFRSQSRSDRLKEQLQSELESALGLKVDIIFLKPNAIPRVDGKANRLLDLRKK
jgi:phenylacetate-CoA ligase